jgi:hypothetical protein
MIKVGSNEYTQLLNEAHKLILDENYPGDPTITRNVSAVVTAFLPRMAVYDTLQNNGITPEENPELQNKMANTLDARIRRLGQYAIINAKETAYNNKIKELPPEPLYIVDSEE